MIAPRLALYNIYIQPLRAALLSNSVFTFKKTSLSVHNYKSAINYQSDWLKKRPESPFKARKSKIHNFP